MARRKCIVPASAIAFLNSLKCSRLLDNLIQSNSWRSGTLSWKSMVPMNTWTSYTTCDVRLFWSWRFTARRLSHFKVCCRLYFKEFNVAPDHSPKGAVEVPPSIFGSFYLVRELQQPFAMRSTPLGLTVSADDSRSKPLPQRVQFDPRSGKESRSSEVMEPRSLL